MDKFDTVCTLLREALNHGITRWEFDEETLTLTGYYDDPKMPRWSEYWIETNPETNESWIMAKDIWGNPGALIYGAATLGQA